MRRDDYLRRHIELCRAALCSPLAIHLMFTGFAAGFESKLTPTARKIRRVGASWALALACYVCIGPIRAPTEIQHLENPKLVSQSSAFFAATKPISQIQLSEQRNFLGLMRLHSSEYVIQHLNCPNDVGTFVEHDTFRPLRHRRIGDFSARRLPGLGDGF